MAQFSVHPLELVLRGSAVYWSLFLLFRFVLRRDAGTLGIPDLLLLVQAHPFSWTREKAIVYAEEHSLPIDVTKSGPLARESIDFAVLPYTVHCNIDAIIRTHAKDRKVAAWLQDA